MQFSTLKVAARLAFGFAATQILLLVVALVSVLSIYNGSRTTDNLLTDKLRNERLVSEWKSIIEVNAARTFGAGKAADPQAQKFFDEAIAASSRQASEIIDHLQASLKDPAARTLYAAAIEQRGVYQKARSVAFAEKAGGNAQAASRYFDQELLPQANAYTESVAKLKKGSVS